MKTVTCAAFSFLILLSTAFAQVTSTTSKTPRPAGSVQAPSTSSSQPPSTGSAQPPSTGSAQAPAPSTNPADPNAQQAPPTPAPASLSPDYKMSRGDKLRVEVYKDAQLSQSLQIRPDGKITLPLLGDIPAAGRTPTELRDAITSALREYISNPVVTVMVVEATPATIYVMGEVNKPGTLNINGPISILQALAMAGGFRDFAHTKDIRILRKSSTGVRTLSFNYNEAIKGNGTPMLLEAGDTIIVP
jgi:polysaccharide biosynthesis/export protein